MSRESIIAEIATEANALDIHAQIEWDHIRPRTWLAWIENYVCLAGVAVLPTGYRIRLVETAATIVRAIEAHDRQQAVSGE